MKPLLVTSGEPAGIGPDICLQLANEDIPLVVIGDKQVLEQRARVLGLSVAIDDFELQRSVTKGALSVWSLPTESPVVPGQLNVDNASYVLSMLEQATDACLQGEFSALVTAPVHKAVMNEAGILFSGHTEFLAERCGVPKVVMMLVSDRMRVALASTHLPLSDVSSVITQDHLRDVIAIVERGLRCQFGIESPRVYIAGLNPHAGENGYLGREEIDVIRPVIESLQAQGHSIKGPLSADTMFCSQNDEACDAYLTMYHDQGLSVIKYASFGNAVNVTLGLPIVRTSVDHGTALELAGSSAVSDSSLKNAIKLAWSMVK